MTSSDDLFDALERCAATPGKKAKLEIIKGLREFRFWLQMALDPTVSYFVAKLPKYERHGVETLDEETDGPLLRKLASREISGNEALQRIEDTMRELTPKSQEVLRRVLLKDLRCGVGDSIVNDAFPGLIPVFPYMRCTLPKDSNIERWDWSMGVYLQLKADGMFANVNHGDDGSLRVLSRNGTTFPVGSLGDLEHVLHDQLSTGTQTHGELLVYNDGELLPRQIGNGILNSLLQGGELPEKHYVAMDVWDQIPLRVAVDKGRYEVPYDDRFERLNLQCAGAHRDLVQPIESEIVYSRAAAMAKCGAYQKRKLEGAICKHRQAIWRDGDNKDQVKLKLEVDVDLQIVGYRPGTPGTRTEATFGAVVCRTADGLLEVGVHGFKREVEADIHARRDELLGGVMTVRANGVMDPTEDGQLHSLFLPRFVELRQDKREADTLQRVRAQFEAAVAA
jgi:DNA ligase-1